MFREYGVCILDGATVDLELFEELLSLWER
jgi:hypothetical protein